MGSAQHYVSQVYLRRFEAKTGEGKVWVYDKEQSRVYPGPTSTGKVAQETDFYNLRGEGKKDDDPEIVEKQLQKFEEGFVEAMDVAVRIAEDRDASGNLEEHARMSKAIAFQHVRTRAWRDRIREAYIEGVERTMDTFWKLACEISGQDPQGLKAYVEDGPIEENRAWALQVKAMMPGGAIDKIATRVDFAFWVIAKNLSSRPFITSDAPVAVEQVVPLESAIPKDSGPFERYIEVKGPSVPAGKGTQTFFPISPRHALVILDPSAYDRVEQRNGKVLVINREATVNQINAAQMRKSRRWLYSSVKDFGGVIPMPSRFLRPVRFNLPYWKDRR